MIRRHTIRTFVFGLTALAAVAYCQEKDWTTLTSKEGSFSAQFPPAWVIGDPEDPSYLKAMAKFKSDNPKIATQMSARASDKQIILAYDTASVSPAGWIDAFNVMKQPHGGLTTKMYEAVYDQVAKSLETKGKLDHKVIDGPNGKALTYWGTMYANVGGDKRELDLYGMLFLKGDNVYVVTFMCNGGELKAKKPVWDKVVKSIKVK